MSIGREDIQSQVLKQSGGVDERLFALYSLADRLPNKETTGCKLTDAWIRRKTKLLEGQITTLLNELKGE